MLWRFVHGRCSTSENTVEWVMKSIGLVAVLMIAAASVLPSTTHAAGCMKGAVVGGVAGHYAGHHGLLGAGAGCLVGRHYARKHARERMT
jgi:hypothetical protein